MPLTTISRRALIGAPLAACVEAQRRAVPPFYAFCMDTHDEKKRTLREQAELLKELGYDGAGHLWLDNLAERLVTLDAAGLRLFQIYLRMNIAADAKESYDPRLPEALPLLKGRGVELALLIIGGQPSDKVGDPRAVELVREVAARASTFGARVVLYPHAKHWLERVEDAVRVAAKVDRDNVGVMFNLCHWLRVADEKSLRPLLRQAAPWLFAVSINGADTAAEIQSGKGKFVQPLDSGSFDLTNLMTVLKEHGYRGPVGLQCFGIPGDARDHLSRSIAAWRKLSALLAG